MWSLDCASASDDDAGQTPVKVQVQTSLALDLGSLSGGGDALSCGRQELTRSAGDDGSKMKVEAMVCPLRNQARAKACS